MTKNIQEQPEQAPEEWKKAFDRLVTDVDPKDAEKACVDLEAFMRGEKTWQEVQGIPQQMMLDIAEAAYLQFKSGRYEIAEQAFKGLCIWDHKSAYYHTALGAIYQKQKKHIDAIAEYTVALDLDPQDITAYVNRGEVYLTIAFHPELYLQALEDFEAAIALDPEGQDPWANRARLLKKQTEVKMKKYKKEAIEKYKKRLSEKKKAKKQ